MALPVGPSFIAQVLQLAGGGAKPSPEALTDLRVAASPTAIALLASLPDPEPPTRLPKLMPRAPAEATDLVRELLQLMPSQRASAARVLAHPYLASFVAQDATRQPYAEAAVAPPAGGAAGRFVPPVNDATRLTVHEYRSLLQAGLAEPLADPVPMSRTSNLAVDVSDGDGAANDEDDMGA